MATRTSPTARNLSRATVGTVAYAVGNAMFGPAGGILITVFVSIAHEALDAPLAGLFAEVV